MLLTWLRCRGDFMFLDGVAQSRRRTRTWTEFRYEANSLFWFRFLFSIVVTLLSLASVAIGALVALPDIQRQEFGPLAAVGILLSVMLLTVTVITASCVGVFLSDIVVPIMYQRRITVMDGWREFDRLIFADHKGTLIVYLLFRIVIGLVTSLLALFATCCTCCLAALPFVGTVILLPLFVFARSYSLYFLAIRTRLERVCRRYAGNACDRGVTFRPGVQRGLRHFMRRPGRRFCSKSGMPAWAAPAGSLRAPAPPQDRVAFNQASPRRTTPARGASEARKSIRCNSLVRHRARRIHGSIGRPDIARFSGEPRPPAPWHTQRGQSWRDVPRHCMAAP